jgi:hypothetical protein
MPVRFRSAALRWKSISGEGKTHFSGVFAMNIYLAARYSRREELCRYRESLRSLGYRITSRWLDGGHELDERGLSTEAGAVELARGMRVLVVGPRENVFHCLPEVEVFPDWSSCEQMLASEAQAGLTA